MQKFYHAIYIIVFVTLFAGCNQKHDVSGQQDAASPAEQASTIGMPPEKAGLPPELVDAWKQAFPDVNVASFSTTTTDAGKTYSVSNIGDGYSYELLANPDGSVIETRFDEAVAVEDIPAAAMETMQQKYPGNEVMDTWRITRNGEVTYYANVFLKEDGDKVRKAGFVLGPDGAVIKESSVSHAKGQDYGRPLLL